MSKYLNEAVIGNKNILATFTSKGEFLRIFYPNRDSRQFLELLNCGIKVNDSDIIYLHDDINNVYKQYYDTDTNILNTEITNTYFNLKILQTDFAMVKEDVLVRRYLIINESNIDLNINFLVRSKLLTDQNNFVGAKIIDGGVIQHSHDFSLSIFSKNELLSHQLNGVKDAIHNAVLQDKDYIAMSNDVAISYDLETIKPGEKKVLDVCILLNDSKKTINDVENEIERIKKIEIQKEYNNARTHWKKYIKEHNTLEFKEPKNAIEEKVQDIYKRSILLFPLLTNHKTGGIIAAPEVDEGLSKCGRYGYCWTRDAVFITKALDILDMNSEVDKFYSNFCKQTQSKNGMWEQRFYTDGRLAPSWGYQIDETASVVYGIYNHYLKIKSEKFLKENLQMCEKAVDFLKRYVKDIFCREESIKEGKEYAKKYHVSYDLWEMCEGEHLYSFASIFAAFDAILKIYKELGRKVSDFEGGNRLKDEKVAKSSKEIEELQTKIKKYVNEKMYDTSKGTYLRNTNDQKMDISILGAVTPFKMFTAKEKKVQNTVEKINLTLRTYTGGYTRFENDHYMNNQPWVISNLWMALYYLEKGEKKKAKEAFEFVIKTSGKHGFLGEQIDNLSLKPNWVIGLGWSHAMFIIVLEKILKG